MIYYKEMLIIILNLLIVNNEEISMMNLIGKPIESKMLIYDELITWVVVSDELVSMVDIKNEKILREIKISKKSNVNLDFLPLIIIIEHVLENYRLEIVDIISESIMLSHNVYSSYNLMKIYKINDSIKIIVGDKLIDINPKSLSISESTIPYVNNKTKEISLVNDVLVAYELEDDGLIRMIIESDTVVKRYKIESDIFNLVYMKENVYYMKEQDNKCILNYLSYDKDIFTYIELDKNLCNSVKLCDIDKNIVVIPFYSDLLNEINVILNSDKVIKINIEPITKFKFLQTHKNIVYFISLIDNLYKIGELRFNDDINIKYTSISFDFEIYKILIFDDDVIIGVNSDYEIFIYYNNILKKYNDLSLSSILSIYPLPPTFTQSYNEKLIEFGDSYFSEENIVKKFWIRLNYDLGVIYDLINLNSINEIYDSIIDIILSLSNEIHENPLVLITSKGGIIQLISVYNMKIIWRIHISNFNQCNDISIIPLNNTYPIYKNYLAVCVNFNQTMVYIFKIDDGSVCENCIKDFNIIPEYSRNDSLLYFSHSQIPFYPQFIGSINNLVNKMNQEYYYFYYDKINYTLNGYLIRISNSEFNIIHIWNMYLHANLTNLTILVNNQLYKFTSYSPAIINSVHMFKDNHENAIYVTYFYYTNKLNFHARYIDGKSGAVLNMITRNNCKPPSFSVMSQNIIATIYINSLNVYELIVMEKFINSSGIPLFITQNYIIDIVHITAFSITSSRQGMIQPTLLIATPGRIIALPYTMYSSTRPNNNINLSIESDYDLIEYKPYLKISHILVISGNYTIYNVYKLIHIPLYRESSSFVCAFSPNRIYCFKFSNIMRTPFDSLNSDFGSSTLFIILLGVFIVMILLINYYNNKQITDNWDA